MYKQKVKKTLTWRWNRRCLGRLLFAASLHLLDDRQGINIAAIKVALEGQQVFGVVLPQRIRGTTARTDAQESGDILPGLALGHLAGESRREEIRRNIN